MPVTSIYLTRHGFRGTYRLDRGTNTYRSDIRSPTGIPTDPALTSYGAQQSQQLAERLVKVTPAIAGIYSSPFYRCLETITPTAEKMGVKICGDYGLGEWFGHATFAHPPPASPEVLGALFSSWCGSYRSSSGPPGNGESIDQLHDRCARTLANIIRRVDEQERHEDVSLLICTHAAPLIAMGRVLTGYMPEDTAEQDFKTFTCGILLFERRSSGRNQGVIDNSITDGRSPPVDWKDGKGLEGGWDCVLNGDCRHLTGGQERAWYFSGDEAFDDIAQKQPQGNQIDSAAEVKDKADIPSKL